MRDTFGAAGIQFCRVRTGWVSR
ncbi:hypothetical protein YPPY11_1929, partial [Yersinia pestis PY-11]